MVAGKRARKKVKGVGLSCRQCGEPLYVKFTRPQGRKAVARNRVCRACGWECRTAEVIVETPPAAGA
jgi:hypothetical protein